MKTIVAKLDDETARELDELAKYTSRSDVVREAVRRYVAMRRIEQRRQEVEEYMSTRTPEEADKMREMAEAHIEEAAELLRRVEDET